MSSTLELIAELEDLLSSEADIATAEKWWDAGQKLVASIELDNSKTEQEREIISLLKTGISKVISAVREGRTPDFGTATSALTELRQSIERRTAYRTYDCQDGFSALSTG